MLGWGSETCKLHWYHSGCPYVSWDHGIKTTIVFKLSKHTKQGYNSPGSQIIQYDSCIRMQCYAEFHQSFLTILYLFPVLFRYSLWSHHYYTNNNNLSSSSSFLSLITVFISIITNHYRVFSEKDQWLYRHQDNTTLGRKLRWIKPVGYIHFMQWPSTSDNSGEIRMVDNEGWLKKNMFCHSIYDNQHWLMPITLSTLHNWRQIAFDRIFLKHPGPVALN